MVGYIRSYIIKFIIDFCFIHTIRKLASIVMHKYKGYNV